MGDILRGREAAVLKIRAAVWDY